MLIYHGTKRPLLDSILADGIQPRKMRPSQWQEHPSRSDLVYLTSYAHFFYGRDRFGLSVVEIDGDKLDHNLLLPDEDYLHQIHKLPLDKARERLENYQADWEASLREFGTCAYKGQIDHKCIRKACFIDLSDARALTMFYEKFEIMETSNKEFQSKGLLIGGVTDWVFGRSNELPKGIIWDSNMRDFIKLLLPPAS